MKTIIWIWSTWYGARTARTGTNTQIKNGDVAAASIGMMTYSIDLTSRQIMMTFAVMGIDEMNDTISRQAAINKFEPWLKVKGYSDGELNMLKAVLYELTVMPSAQPERMTNRQWIDFLSVQFDISRTSAKEMLHGMMQWKKEDNFKKMFNGGKT